MTIYRYMCNGCGRTFDTSFAASACPVCDDENIREESSPVAARLTSDGNAAICEGGGDCGNCGACDPSMIRAF